METFFGQDLDRRQITETIAEIDYDNDGKLSYREFLEQMCALKQNKGKRSKFGNFYHVLTLKNPPFWNSRVGRIIN
jgi:Ca2+-binding EF-hand superfamily protein